MDIKVSIIIPVYNSEKFLKRCLDSCINQTLDEIEVIAVNDASPDRSDIIMREYEEKYPKKVQCIYLQENLRQGGARNVAIRHARGEFITFVDSDDWIRQEMCEELYTESLRTKADIVYCNMLEQTKNDSFLISNRFPNEAVGNVCENIVTILFQPYVGPVAHIIKNEIITHNGLFFPEGIFSEDTAITKIWDLYADKIAKIEGAYYTYCLNKESTSREQWTGYRRDEYASIKLLYDNLIRCPKAGNQKMEVRLICMKYALNFIQTIRARCNGRFETEIEEDFRSCIHYVCGELTENESWKYWFTPKEKEFLMTKIDFGYFDSNEAIIEDYRQYYERLMKEIDDIAAWFAKKGINRIGIWGKTNYGYGLNKVFPAMKIVDNLSRVEAEHIQAVICLRMNHIPNVRNQLREKNVEIFNLQSYLTVGGGMKAYCYDN